MIDEATTNSSKKTLVACLRFFLKDKPSSLFLDLIELPKADSQIILDCLRKHGMDSGYLQEHLICFATDGASDMIGRSSGITTKLREMFPSVVFWHCANHSALRHSASWKKRSKKLRNTLPIKMFEYQTSMGSESLKKAKEVLSQNLSSHC